MATSEVTKNTIVFMIHYYPLGSAVEVELKDTTDLTFGKVKTETGRILMLRPESVQMFGLFLGQLGSLTRLCHDEDKAILPRREFVLSFQRLSFDEDLERRITEEDDQAMELIFWEIKEQYESNLILPKLKVEHNDFLERAMMLLGKVSASNRKRFVQVIYSQILYYWSYYYRASNCIVHNDITVKGKVCLGRGMQVHVALNLEKVFFVETSGDVELASWQWCCVRCVKMQNTPKELIKFEVFVVGSSELVPLRLITMETKQNKYLYTIVTHILKVKERDYLEKHGSFPFGPSIAVAEMVTKDKVQQYLNRCFHDPTRKVAHEVEIAQAAPRKPGGPQKYEKLKYQKLPEVRF